MARSDTSREITQPHGWRPPVLSVQTSPGGRLVCVVLLAGVREPEGAANGKREMLKAPKFSSRAKK